ncbi:MAG: cell division protein SepF [Nanoarchaeota archaeon]
MAFDLKRMFGKETASEDYLEIDVNQASEAKNRVIVRPFTLKQYDDITDILNALREGYTIAVIDIKQLRTKDVIELKRSVAKIKKTVEAMEGSIAGFGENIIIATPAFAEVHKAIEKTDSGSGKKDSLEFY